MSSSSSSSSCDASVSITDDAKVAFVVRLRFPAVDPEARHFRAHMLEERLYEFRVVWEDSESKATWVQPDKWGAFAKREDYVRKLEWLLGVDDVFSSHFADDLVRPERVQETMLFCKDGALGIRLTTEIDGEDHQFCYESSQKIWPGLLLPELHCEKTGRVIYPVGGDANPNQIMMTVHLQKQEIRAYYKRVKKRAASGELAEASPAKRAKTDDEETIAA